MDVTVVSTSDIQASLRLEASNSSVDRRCEFLTNPKRGKHVQMYENSYEMIIFECANVIHGMLDFIFIKSYIVLARLSQNPGQNPYPLNKWRRFFLNDY